jgi:hypothetical protein
MLVRRATQSSTGRARSGLGFVPTSAVPDGYSNLPVATRMPMLVLCDHLVAFKQRCPNHAIACKERFDLRRLHRCGTGSQRRPDTHGRFGTPRATPNRHGHGCPSTLAMSTPAAPTWRSPSTVSDELLSSKHKSSSLAGIARTAAPAVIQQCPVDRARPPPTSAPCSAYGTSISLLRAASQGCCKYRSGAVRATRRFPQVLADDEGGLRRETHRTAVGGDTGEHRHADVLGDGR